VSRPPTESGHQAAGSPTVEGQLAGKVAVITGGVSGIGRGAVELFVRQGAKVVIGDISDKAGSALADSLPDVEYLHADVTREADVEALVAAAVARFGRLDVMFNNAASAGDQSSILDLDANGMDHTMRLVAGSVVAGHRFASRQFIAQGTGGSIISTASGASFQGGWSPTAYTIGKHAVVGIVRQAAGELGRHGIRTNAIAPGIIMTPIMCRTFGIPVEHAAAFIEHVADRLKHHQPLGRVGRPRDIALAAAFLASDASEWITGTVLPVDGGLVAVTHSTLLADIGQAAQQFAAERGLPTTVVPA
jgi:NAD(P)-dependent dehydrogenase (short-subunit alcohol dehydrogenase family)